jgi:hypothetical protein
MTLLIKQPHLRPLPVLQAILEPVILVLEHVDGLVEVILILGVMEIKLFQIGLW